MIREQREEYKELSLKLQDELDELGTGGERTGAGKIEWTAGSLMWAVPQEAPPGTVRRPVGCNVAVKG